MKKCEKCGKEFENARAYGGHVTQCQNFVKCEKCGKKFNKPSYFQHLKSHEGVKQCLQCGKDIGKRFTFCSLSCRTIYCNKGVRRHGKEPSNCLTCGKKLDRSEKKYCNNRCQQDYEWIEVKNEIESSGVFSKNDYMARRIAKKYLIERDGHKCSICGNIEWMGKPIPLISDHIDGDHNNNKVENFRLVCGNCDMQLPTFAGKNKGNGRLWRREYDRKHAEVAERSKATVS